MCGSIDMQEYTVELTTTLIVEAENEDEAVEKALDNAEIESLYAYVDGKPYG